jgi:hypothetical protein
MTKITTRWGKELYAMIFCHNLKPSKINALAKKYARSNEAGNDLTEAVKEDIELLVDAVLTIEPVCIKSHRDSGLALLHNMAYTPKGNRRSTPDSAKFDEHELRVLANATEIALVRFDIQFGNYGRCSALPIFEVRSDVGKFRYWYRSWQSGAGFEIISD